jgi:putative ABC transport system substrate-binding protein
LSDAERVAVVAAKAATATIPIVFTTAANPVRLGLVASLNRPGGNVTGVTILVVETASKRLELLHELIPAVSTMALLLNPANATLAQANESEVRAAAESLGLKLHVLGASTEADFDGVFAKVIELRLGGLVIGGDPFAVRHAVPTVYENREFIAAGGLIGYGGSITDAYRLAMPPDFSRAACDR